MAEIDFNVLARACLKKRNSGENTQQIDIRVLEAEPNEAETTINRCFTST